MVVMVVVLWIFLGIGFLVGILGDLVFEGFRGLERILEDGRGYALRLGRRAPSLGLVLFFFDWFHHFFLFWV